jgi:membrane protease YdiL (CAAX protease family)
MSGDAAAPLRPAPGRRELVLILGLVFVLNLTVGAALEVLSPRLGLLATEVLFLAFPVVAVVRLFYLEPRSVLPLRPVEARYFATAIVGSACLNHLLGLYGAWQERFAPTPEWVRAVFANLFEARSPAEFALVLLCIACVPALCEEILFRGFVQAGVMARASSRTAGIAFVALLFAAFHLDPWRFTPLFVLGLFFSWLRMQSGSLWPPIVAHAVNNALTIGLAEAGWLSDTSAPGTSLTALLAVSGCAAAIALSRPRAVRGAAGRML